MWNVDSNVNEQIYQALYQLIPTNSNYTTHQRILEYNQQLDTIHDLNDLIPPTTLQYSILNTGLHTPIPSDTILFRLDKIRLLWHWYYEKSTSIELKTYEFDLSSYTLYDWKLFRWFMSCRLGWTKPIPHITTTSYEPLYVWELIVLYHHERYLHSEYIDLDNEENDEWKPQFDPIGSPIRLPYGYLSIQIICFRPIKQNNGHQSSYRLYFPQTETRKKQYHNPSQFYSNGIHFTQICLLPQTQYTSDLLLPISSHTNDTSDAISTTNSNECPVHMNIIEPPVPISSSKNRKGKKSRKQPIYPDIQSILQNECNPCDPHSILGLILAMNQHEIQQFEDEDQRLNYFIDVPFVLLVPMEELGVAHLFAYYYYNLILYGPGYNASNNRILLDKLNHTFDRIQLNIAILRYSTPDLSFKGCLLQSIHTTLTSSELQSMIQNIYRKILTFFLNPINRAFFSYLFNHTTDHLYIYRLENSLYRMVVRDYYKQEQLHPQPNDTIKEESHSEPEEQSEEDEPGSDDEKEEEEEGDNDYQSTSLSYSQHTDDYDSSYPYESKSNPINSELWYSHNIPTLPNILPGDHDEYNHLEIGRDLLDLDLTLHPLSNPFLTPTTLSTPTNNNTTIHSITSIEADLFKTEFPNQLEDLIDWYMITYPEYDKPFHSIPSSSSSSSSSTPLASAAYSLIDLLPNKRFFKVVMLSNSLRIYTEYRKRIADDQLDTLMNNWMEGGRNKVAELMATMQQDNDTHNRSYSDIKSIMATIRNHDHDDDHHRFEFISHSLFLHSPSIQQKQKQPLPLLQEEEETETTSTEPQLYYSPRSSYSSFLEFT